MPFPAYVDSMVETQMSIYNGKDEDYFRRIPWCREYLDNPSYAPANTGIPRDWDPTGAGSHHTFLTKTLNTPDTIAASYTLQKKPAEGQSVIEIMTLMALGSDMNGHIDTLHGGTVATILDEIAGVMLHTGRRPGGNPSSHVFTAYLNVSYKKPVRTPQIIIVKARIAFVEGRKEKVLVEMLNRYDEVLSSAEALFIRVKSEEKL